MKMRKTMSLFLALAMSASMPFAALATETEPLDPLMQVQTEGAAKIGETSYNTLEDAIKNAENGNTIILVDNVANGASVEIPAEKNLKLDLNGKNYTISNVKAGTNYGFSVNKTGQSGTVTFTNGTIAAGAGVVSLIENSANVRLSNVKLSANGSKALLNKADATASIEDANVIVDGNIENAGTLTIKGGNFNGDVANSGTLTVEKGKFTKNITGNGRLSISGGNFDGNIDASNGEISGGAFSIKPDDKFLTPNMKFEMLDPNSGKYVVSEKKAENVDLGKENMTAPTEVTEESDYKTIECSDSKLRDALKNIVVSIPQDEFLAKVPSITKQQALDAYNKANDPDLALDNIDKLSVVAKKKLKINVSNVSVLNNKGFNIKITPSVVVYIQNKDNNSKAEYISSDIDQLRATANVTVPLSSDFNSVREFSVTQNGKSENIVASNNSIELRNVSNFRDYFAVLERSNLPDTELPKPNDSVKVENTEITVSSSASREEKNLAEAINRGFKLENVRADLTNIKVKKSDAIEALKKKGYAADENSDIRLEARIKVTPTLSAVNVSKNNEGFTFSLSVEPKIYAVLNGKTRNVAEAPVENSGIVLEKRTATVTIPLSVEFSKIKENIVADGRKFIIKNAVDSKDIGRNNEISFKTDNVNDAFYIKVSEKEPTPPPSGHDEQITVLDGTYKIKDKKLIKTDSNNTIKFDESAYLVVVKGGYQPSTNANNVEPEYFLTKDDVSKLRIGTVRFEENGKLVDGKVSWQARMIKVDGKNKGVYLIEIPIKKNSGYTSSKDVFGNFELRASKPYYFGNDETRENVNFYVEIDADVNTDTDEIYDGTHVYEFNDTEDDEITLYGGDGTFIVDTRGQGKLLIRTDVKYNEGIEKVNPNANYVYYNSNYPTFNRLGYLYLKANKGDKIYKVDRDTGKLTKMPVPYDRDMEAFKIRTRTLGCYVVAEKELDLDRINGVIAPEPVKPPVAPPSIINPPTGSAI